MPVAESCEVVCDSRPSSSWVPSRTAQIVLAFASIYLIWGSTFLGIRVALETIPPMVMAGLRWTVAGWLFYLFLRWRGAPRPSARDWRSAGLIGGGIVFAGNGSVTFAEQHIPSGTTAVIVALVPAVMVLMGWLSGTLRRPRLPVWCGIAIATFGVAVIVQPTALAFTPQLTLSLVLLTIGESLWAAASLYAVRVRTETSGFMMAAMQMICGGVLGLIAAFGHGEFSHFNPAAVTLRSLGAMTYLAAIGSIVGFSAFLWLLRNVEATRVSTYAYVNPVVAVFLGSWLGGEKLAPELLAGSALVVFGIALIVTFRSRPLI
ncbi:MAG TPA: EamA family transporter [Chthoniobacterales bacterium]|nr:EamA family transporter [Chthoniobacterales bacterium]